MPKLNFRGVVTTCAVSLFAVSSVNAQQGGAVQRLNIESNASDTQVLLNAGVIATQDIQGWDTSNVPSISQHMRQSLFAIEGTKNLVGLRRKLPSVPRHFFGSKVITGTNYTVDELETAGFTKSEVEEAMNDTPFTRNMVKKDLDNACKSNGSAQNCAETFEAAAIVVAVNDPYKSSAAIWTGQTAKKVSDEIVKLEGTQEQIKNVIDTSVNVIGFMDNQLQPNVSIAGGKESAALNLVKTSLNLMKTKPTPKRLVDDPANCGSDPNFDRCYNPPIIDALEQISFIGSPAINNQVIGPVMLKYNEQVAVAKANNTSDPVASTGSANVGVGTTTLAATASIVAATAVAVQAATRGWEERKASEARKHSEQRDAATAAEMAQPASTQPQEPQQQVVQQQQQQNCNPQWQDC